MAHISFVLAIYWVGVFPHRGRHGGGTSEPPCAAPSWGKNTAAVFVGFFAYNISFCCQVVFMFYQVFASYKVSHGKPSLFSLSLHSSSIYLPYLVSSWSSYLSQSRYFLSITEANHYISFLFSRYSKCAIPRPVLYALQLSLF
jgi:hypothetical protein